MIFNAKKKIIFEKFILKNLFWKLKLVLESSENKFEQHSFLMKKIRKKKYI